MRGSSKAPASMRRARNLLPMFILALMAAPDAVIAQPLKDAQHAPGTVRASRIGGLGFAIPAVRADNDDVLKGITGWVADALGLQCERMEAFTWSDVETDPEKSARIFLSIDQAFQVEGYTYARHDLPQPEDKAIAEIQKRITAYSGEPSDRFSRDKRIVTVWHRGSDDLNLMLCSARPKPPEKDEEDD